MKKKQSKKARAKAAVKREKPFVEAPAGVSVSKPAGPPLAGEALEEKVAEVLCERFRRAAERAALREKCQGAEHAAIEAAIVSPRVRTSVEPVAQAYALEHAISVLQLFFSNAKAALENEKPTAAQITALKIVFEVLVEKMMERIVGGLWQESAGVFFSSDFEKSVVENMLQLLRGQKAPAADELQRAPKNGADRAMAGDGNSELPGEIGG